MSSSPNRASGSQPGRPGHPSDLGHQPGRTEQDLDPTSLLSDASQAFIASRGFSLIELIVAMAVVAVLSAMAIPAYSRYVTKARRADAFQALATVSQAQERYRSNSSTYADSLAPLNVPPNAHYDISLSPVTHLGVTGYEAGYLVTAVPKAHSSQAKDSNCKSISLLVLGGNFTHKSASDSNQDTSPSCWPR